MKGERGGDRTSSATKIARGIRGGERGGRATRGAGSGGVKGNECGGRAWPAVESRAWMACRRDGVKRPANEFAPGWPAAAKSAPRRTGARGTGGHHRDIAMHCLCGEGPAHLMRSCFSVGERQALCLQGAAKLLERIWSYPVEILDLRLADRGQLGQKVVTCRR
jgi:hypothetical protein